MKIKMKSTSRYSNLSIWIIAPFSHFDSNRFLHIARSISDRGYDVTFFTSIFNHYKKKKKDISQPVNGIKFKFIYEPGYFKNVSIRRLLSHGIFDIYLLFSCIKVIVVSGSPNSIYCAIPHNFASVFIGILSKFTRSKFIVDIHDTWPESILSVYALKKWLVPFYHIWKFAASVGIRLADVVFAESQKYAERADAVRLPHQQSPANCVYLGGDLSYYAQANEDVQLPTEIEEATKRFVYVGNLGVNYDLESVIKVFARLKKYYPKACLVFLGGGEQESKLRGMARDFGINAWFSGFIEHKDLVSILSKMDYGINSFASGGNVAYSYKLNDYLLVGIPVINNLPGEAWSLVDQFGLGYNYKAGYDSELLNVLCCACKDPSGKFSENVLSFASSHLDWHKTYEPILRELITRK